ncbi:hypothetical protein HDU93_008047 [Gonapodya sp. JEL0774]|nr:hypothetical protein HDU93_008047 [Gonapodya sp. JEL0774]
MWKRGRVGAAVSRSLIKIHPTILIHVAGRNAERGLSLCRELGETRSAFVKVDVTKYETIVAAMKGTGNEKGNQCAIVVNCAGPFQESTDPAVLRAAIETGTPYLDVCDDSAFGRVAKGLHKDALARGVPCVTTGGLFPGLSNVIAKEFIETLGGKEKCKTVEFDYWVAGTGGLGTTVLTTSFMILRIPATNYRHNVAYETMPMASEGSRVVPFPSPIGPRRTYLFDLPEVHSIRETCGIPTVEARFATAPDFFNQNMRVVGEKYGEQLKDRELVDGIVRWQEPFIRLVDWFVGEGVGMSIRASTKEAPPLDRVQRGTAASVEVGEIPRGSPDSTHSTVTLATASTTTPNPSTFSDTTTLSATFYHPSCVVSIGYVVACTALCMTPAGAASISVASEGAAGGDKVKPGVWYPEEMFSCSEDRRAFVKWAVSGGSVYAMGMEWW